MLTSCRRSWIARVACCTLCPARATSPIKGELIWPISWNAHGSVEIWLLEHLYLDEFARDENMTRFRMVYLRSGRLRRYEICTDNRTRVNATE